MPARLYERDPVTENLSGIEVFPHWGDVIREIIIKRIEPYLILMV